MLRRHLRLWPTLDSGRIDGVFCDYSSVESHMMLSSVICEYYGIAARYSLHSGRRFSDRPPRAFQDHDERSQR
jgi:hypothetical protein